MPVETQADSKRGYLPEEYRPAQWLLESPYRPPNASSSDLIPINIFSAVGYITTLWEMLENTLSWLFLDSIEDGRKPLIAEFYGTASGFSARLEMFYRSSIYGLNSEEVKVRRDLKSDLARAAGLRNLVAHSIVALCSPGSIEAMMPLDFKRELPPNHGYQLVTAPYNSSRTNGFMNPVTFYDSRTLLVISAEFEKLISRIAAISTLGEPKYMKFIRFKLHWNDEATVE